MDNVSITIISQFNEHNVVESHPDNTVPDLRLDRPFPSLIKHKEAYDLNTMSDKDRCHVPYAMLLLKYLDEWKIENGDLPKNHRQKEDFRKFIAQRKRLEICNYDNIVNYIIVIAVFLYILLLVYYCEILLQETE